MQGTANPIGVAHLRRTLKPKDLAEYYRKTIKEYCEFVRSYEIVFRLLPQEFCIDYNKVI